MQKPEDIQREYYERTSGAYDDMHVHPGDEHYIALRHISDFLEKLGIKSILDIGCGTGRGVKYLMEHHPGLEVKGIEPVAALIDQAVEKNKIPRGLLIRGLGENLPFEDKSMDAVCEFGILHHMKNPDAVVKEMVRVARKAVFISDSNRFGQRNLFIRLVKFLLYKSNLWNAANFVKTAGRGYTVSTGDGLSYSYSVFDSFKTLKKLSDKIIIIPTEKGRKYNWLPSIINSSHILLCAIKKPNGATDQGS